MCWSAGNGKGRRAAKNGSQSSAESSDSERQQVQLLRSQLAEQQRLIDELTKYKGVSVHISAFDVPIDPTLSASSPKTGIVLVSCAEVGGLPSQTISAQPLVENTTAVNVHSQSGLVFDSEDLYGDPEPPPQLRKHQRNPIIVRKTVNRRAWLDFRVSLQHNLQS
jgi:hypothetical protein